MILWRGAWQPTPVFLPGKSHGQRSLAGQSPWGCKELDTTEVTQHTHRHCKAVLEINQPRKDVLNKKRKWFAIWFSTQFRVKLRIGTKKTKQMRKKQAINFRIKQKVVKESICSQSRIHSLAADCMCCRKREKCAFLLGMRESVKENNPNQGGKSIATTV